MSRALLLPLKQVYRPPLLPATVTFRTWYGENAPILTDMLFSEEAVSGITDKSGPAQDLNAVITPTSNNDDINTNHINYFWHEGYNGIGYANTIISNIDRVPGLDAPL
jgi:hypothetical protein